jgi:exosome complex exonuclease RRP6
VSLFDTFHASNALQFPSKSLAYLLLKYVDIEADKKYQLADWRIRPLPLEMMAYARSDTHYLLYIYDQLRRDLAARSKDMDRDLITDVLDASRKIAMISYRRERYDFEEGSGIDGWRKLLLNNKGPKLHSNLQLTVFKRIHRWRDQIAREEDESVNYVLPNRSLMNIAASLPHNMQAVVAACHPVPPLVQVYAEDLAFIVQKTRKELAEEAAKAETLAAEAITGTVDSSFKNGVTGSTHLWYKDENTAPNGVKSAIEAVKHGSQFDVWEDQTDRLIPLIQTSSQFWEPLQREYKPPIHELGGDLEDVKLSVPLPPLTAQIYMTAEDLTVVGDNKGDNVAALAEHPFVQRSKEERKEPPQERGSDIIIARKMGKKEKKKREREETDVEFISGDTAAPLSSTDSVIPSTSTLSAEDKPLRAKKKARRGKGLKEKVETEIHTPLEQFDPYRITEPAKQKNKEPKGKGAGAGKSMTFK